MFYTVAASKLTLVGAMPSTVKLREDYSAEERSTRAGVCSLRASSRRTACIGGNACFGRVRRRRKISESSGAGADRLWKMVGDSLTWGVSGQARHAMRQFPARPQRVTPTAKCCRLRRPLACHPQSGAKRSGAGSEATLTRRRPATLSRASAPLRALGLPLRSLPRSFILALRILLMRLDPKREPVFRHAALTAASPHIRSSLWGSDHNPSCSRASGSGWRGPSC